MDGLFKRKFGVRFLKIRGWGHHEETKENKENVIENREWIFMLRAASACGEDIKYVEQTIIKDINEENVFEINEDRSLQRMKNMVGFRQNQ